MVNTPTGVPCGDAWPRGTPRMPATRMPAGTPIVGTPMAGTPIVGTPMAGTPMRMPGMRAPGMRMPGMRAPGMGPRAWAPPLERCGVPRAGDDDDDAVAAAAAALEAAPGGRLSRGIPRPPLRTPYRPPGPNMRWSVLVKSSSALGLEEGEEAEEAEEGVWAGYGRVLEGAATGMG